MGLRALILSGIASVALASPCSSITAGSTNLGVDGGHSEPVWVVQSGGTATGQVLTSPDEIRMGFNPRTYFARSQAGGSCPDSFTPTMFQDVSVLDRTVAFEVDVSGIDCGCVAAVYLVQMPGRSASGEPNASKAGDYYCDANRVGGVYCPEMDLMEANKHALQVTPHVCDAPTAKGFYPSCDHGGCGMNTRKLDENAFGPGSSFTIDSRQPFNMSLQFQSSPATRQLDRIITTVSQPGRSFVIQHNASACSSRGGLAALTQPLASGMVVAMAHWGGTQSQVEWLDSPPCSNSTTQRCDEQGQMIIRRFRVF